MLRNKPRLAYCGLTIVLANPSRFDKLRLLSANGGAMFNDHCLRPEFNLMQCDVRMMEDDSPFLPNTRCVLLLGESAMWKYVPSTRLNTLNEMRGSLLKTIHNIPAIASFLPQEAVDLRNYESTLNPLCKDYTPDDTVSDDDEEDEGDVKRHSNTKRANYSFWLKRDVWKCKQILAGYLGRNNTPQPKYSIYPSSDEVVSVLTSTKNTYLDFDIETDYEQQNLQCFSFSFGDSNDVYSVPILDHNYHPAYAAYPRILRALAIAIKDNIVVAHNGACFDFFVLAHKYHIPIVRAYDTLIAMHRCFPDVEKSLGHCVSYWTWEPFHKDEDSLAYRTHQQMMDRMAYCGKDVWTMKLVRKAITEYARTIPGLEQSISDAMACIRPYLTSTLQGIQVNKEKVERMCNENDVLMMQYNRMAELLIGKEGMSEVRSVIKGRASMFAGSNKQCAQYFHNMLGYPVVAYGKANAHGQKSPSLGKKALFKLALKHDNPVIPLICAYRAVAKETSRLRFEPWINTNEIHTQPTTTSEVSGQVGQERETATDGEETTTDD